VTTLVDRPSSDPAIPDLGRPGAWGWVTTTDHKRIGVMIFATALILFLAMGAVALVMRAQLAVPGQHLLGNQTYNELFTLHGSGMIFLVVTPLAIGLGVYLVPLHIGAPRIAAPRLTLFSYWLYVCGALLLLAAFLPAQGASDGWYAFAPLSNSRYTPGLGMNLWILGSFLAVTAMMVMAGTVLWTALRLRAPGMTMLRMPVMTWSVVATCLMTVAAFPALLASDTLLTLGRYLPGVVEKNTWVVGYQFIFWFFGHPVVYVMFFPFVGCVAEVISTFSGRKYAGYKATVAALLVFAAGSMAVWGHHMFTTGQAANGYYSLTSNFLALPAGIEYFGFLSNLLSGRLRFPTPMLFALAFIPQFLVGGLTGIMLAAPVLDYQFHGTYFVVAHFHYTLFAGSVFGFFAGFYFWFPKVTGVMLREGLGKLHFWLMVVGTNLTFLPMFVLGFTGLPRREATVPTGFGFGLPTLLSSVGAAVIAVGMLVLVVNVVESLLDRRPAGADPWTAHTLEWATSSPPPPYNFNRRHPVPPVTSYAPLLDRRERAGGRRPALAGADGHGAL
jgi:cytochrome c oxidase subunit 1